MAVVRHLKRINLEKDNHHTEVECTYSVVTDESGRRYLQFDTYGSMLRKIPGKKSQSIRFAPEAIEELKMVLSTEHL